MGKKKGNIKRGRDSQSAVINGNGNTVLQIMGDGDAKLWAIVAQLLGQSEGNLADTLGNGYATDKKEPGSVPSQDNLSGEEKPHTFGSQEEKSGVTEPDATKREEVVVDSRKENEKQEKKSSQIGCLWLTALLLLSFLAGELTIKGCHSDKKKTGGDNQPVVASKEDSAFTEEIPVQRERKVYRSDLVENIFKSFVKSSFDKDADKEDVNAAKLFSKSDRKNMKKALVDLFGEKDLREVVRDNDDTRLNKITAKIFTIRDNDAFEDNYNSLAAVRGTLQQYGWKPEVVKVVLENQPDVSRQTVVTGQGQLENQNQMETVKDQKPKKIGKGQDQKRRQKAKRERSGK